MEQIIEYGKTYQEYKEELSTELGKTAEGFVRIGYLMKVARDTDILKESGYANVVEFAKAEYGIDKTYVSRFIKINDRFSEGGYSDKLAERYKNFGYAKLSIMLQLPDEINEELTPEYSKREIEALKDEVSAEQKISDLEVLMEEKDERQQALDGILQQTAYQLGKELPELYANIWTVIMKEGATMRKFMEVLAPRETVTYHVRIPGTGPVMMIIKGAEESAALVNTRRPEEKHKYTLSEILEAFKTICGGEDAGASWETMYGEPFPAKEDREKPEPRKESRVVSAKPQKRDEPKHIETARQEKERSREAAVPEEVEKPEEIKKPEEVERPESNRETEETRAEEKEEKPEVAPVQPELVEEIPDRTIRRVELRQRELEFKDSMWGTTTELRVSIESNNWKDVRVLIQDLEELMDKISDIEEELEELETDGQMDIRDQMEEQA